MNELNDQEDLFKVNRPFIKTIVMARYGYVQARYGYVQVRYGYVQARYGTVTFRYGTVTFRYLTVRVQYGCVTDARTLEAVVFRGTLQHDHKVNVFTFILSYLCAMSG